MISFSKNALMNDFFKTMHYIYSACLKEFFLKKMLLWIHDFF